MTRRKQGNAMDIKRNIYRTETEAMVVAGRLPSMGYTVIGCAQMNTPSRFWAVDYVKPAEKHDDRETCDCCGCKSYRIQDGMCAECWNDGLYE